MRKLFFIVAFIFVLSQVLCAQEFWIQPSKFQAATGEQITVDFKSGKDFIPEAVDIANAKILKFESLHSIGKKDLLPQLQGSAKEKVVLDLKPEGSHIIISQNDISYAEYDAAKFNEYLDDYALDDANYARKKNSQTDKPAKEAFVRYSKAILQSGEKKDDFYKKPVGHPLEIIVRENPASLKVGSRVSFLILYEGKPLFGARVKVWSRYNNRTGTQPIFTEQNGVIETTISTPGPWMVTVVKMIPSKDSKADWFSHQASLTFGIQK